jgi:hypothetical protein
MKSKKWFRKNPDGDNGLLTLGGLIVAASVGISAYHGVKRNYGSVGWGLWWGLMGGLAPVITPAIAIAQGLGQPGPPPSPGPLLAIETPVVSARIP